MQIKCPYPGESEKWFGDELAINVDSKAKHAKAIEFLPGASTWNVCVLTWYPAQLVVWLLSNQRTILADRSLSLIVPIYTLACYTQLAQDQLLQYTYQSRHCLICRWLIPLIFLIDTYHWSDLSMFISMDFNVYEITSIGLNIACIGIQISSTNWLQDQVLNRKVIHHIIVAPRIMIMGTLLPVDLRTNG